MKQQKYRLMNVGSGGQSNLAKRYRDDNIIVNLLRFCAPHAVLLLTVDARAEMLTNSFTARRSTNPELSFKKDNTYSLTRQRNSEWPQPFLWFSFR